MYSIEIYDVIKATVLLLLTLIANFNASTISCQMIKLFNYMLIKHLSNLIIIYLIIDINQPKTESPLKSITTAIVIWISYIIFNRMDINMILLVIGLFIISYIIQKYIEYYKYNNKKLESIKMLTKVKKIIVYLIIILIILGFSSYLYKNIKEHKSKFNLVTFILGRTKCAKSV